MRRQALVPLITYPEANSDMVASNAAALAAAAGAGIHALAVDVDIPDVSNAFSRLLLDVPSMIRQVEADCRKHSNHLLALVKEKAATAGLEVTTGQVSAVPAMLGETAAAHARYFDLSLIGLEAGNPTSRMVAEAVIFGAGRPAVVMPDTVAVASIDHVAIAWDGSRVAARAVADAAVFLERGARVTVLTVLDEKPLNEKDAAERLAAALRQRGVAVESAPINAEDRPIAMTLQEEALRRGCNLLVMGGYGHSRMRDFVLGGATEGVLSELRLPVLLSH